MKFKRYNKHIALNRVFQIRNKEGSFEAECNYTSI